MKNKYYYFLWNIANIHIKSITLKIEDLVLFF